MGYIREYLPDRVLGLNKTRVFIKVYTNDEVGSVSEAIKLLIRSDSSKIQLRRRIRPKRCTVILSACDNPFIEFGCSLPTENPDADIKTILEVIRTNDIEAKLDTALQNVNSK